MYIYNNKGQCIGEIYDNDNDNKHLQWRDSLLWHEDEGEDEDEQQPYMSVLEYVPSWDKYPTMHYWCVSENGVARYSRNMPLIVGDAWEANWMERDADFEESEYNDYGEVWQTILLRSPKGYCPNWKIHDNHNYWAIDDASNKAYYYSSKPYYDAGRKVWYENKENMQYFPVEDLEYPKAEKDLRTLVCEEEGFLTNPNGKGE